MRIVLDTNVIISAFLWTGKTSKVLDIIKDKKVEVYSCIEQITELKEVLERPKFRPIFKTARLKPEIVVVEFLNLAQVVKLAGIGTIIKEDPFDDVIISLARTCKARCIVSGDKHLLTLKKFQRIKILNPREFLKKF